MYTLMYPHWQKSYHTISMSMNLSLISYHIIVKNHNRTISTDSRYHYVSQTFHHPLNYIPLMLVIEAMAGTTVRVLELVDLEHEQRLRARLAHPAGWITLRNSETGRCPRWLWAGGSPGSHENHGEKWRICQKSGWFLSVFRDDIQEIIVISYYIRYLRFFFKKSRWLITTGEDSDFTTNSWDTFLRNTSDLSSKTIVGKNVFCFSNKQCLVPADQPFSVNRWRFFSKNMGFSQKGGSLKLCQQVPAGTLMFCFPLGEIYGNPIGRASFCWFSPYMVNLIGVFFHCHVWSEISWVFGILRRIMLGRSQQFRSWNRDKCYTDYSYGFIIWSLDIFEGEQIEAFMKKLSRNKPRLSGFVKKWAGPGHWYPLIIHHIELYRVVPCQWGWSW